MGKFMFTSQCLLFMLICCIFLSVTQTKRILWRKYEFHVIENIPKFVRNSVFSLKKTFHLWKKADAQLQKLRELDGLHLVTNISINGSFKHFNKLIQVQFNLALDS